MNLQACASLHNIHECEEMLKLPVTEQLETLEKALAEAEKTNCLKSKREILEDIEKCHNSVGNYLEAEAVKQKLSSLGDISSDSEEEEEEESQIECTPNIGESIDLDALSGECHKFYCLVLMLD